MNEAFTEAQKQGSTLNDELRSLVELAKRCHAAGCAPKDIFEEYSKLELPSLE